MKLRNIIALTVCMITFLTIGPAVFLSTENIKRTLSASSENEMNLVLKIFSESIKQDLLIGQYAEIFRKCDMLKQKPKIDSVIIETENDNICDTIIAVKKDQQKKEYILYFDKNLNNKAASVTLIHNTIEYSITKEESIRFIIVAFGMCLAIMLPMIFFSLRYFTRPLSKLAESFAAGKLEYQSLEQTNVSEHALLAKGIKSLKEKMKTYQNDLLVAEKSKSIAQTCANACT